MSGIQEIPAKDDDEIKNKCDYFPMILSSFYLWMTIMFLKIELLIGFKFAGNDVLSELVLHLR